MKRNTIKWRIFKYNIIAIVLLIALTTIIFNIAIRIYIENDITKQLTTIAAHTANAALNKGPEYFNPADNTTPPPPLPSQNDKPTESKDINGFYVMLEHSLREPLSVLNADFILLDNNKEIITSPQGDYFKPSQTISDSLIAQLNDLQDEDMENLIHLNISGTEYIAIIKPMSNENNFGLGWLIIYSSLGKLNQLQWVINTILFAILILSALIIGIFSSLTVKKISAPFSSLNEHIRAIAERNFVNKIQMPVDDELQEFVNNINVMSEKLESYDQAQKTFLQNASHEFRTPLMSIQSYAEGIKYDVVEREDAVNIIIDETKRLTRLVEDLLYLSRLDAIEENYNLEPIKISNFIDHCVDRMNAIAIKNNITLISECNYDGKKIKIDEEKLSRGITNILSNCIRYAQSIVKISSIVYNRQVIITITDDGPGFSPAEIDNIFDRFYKGKKGIFGLGLAISRNIIEKHGGNIIASNSEKGALFEITLPLI